jgi:NADH-quinone oxidoreductase subunit H
MKSLRALAPLTLALALAWFCAGQGSCERGSLPLLRVVSVAPRVVEPGDRIVILGDGFASGKPARVTFRGVLRRSGERPQTGAEVTVWGVVVAPDRIEIAFDDATEALFCDAGDRAVHAAFEGDLQVAFAAAFQGGAPVGGVLPGVRLDLLPAARASDAKRMVEGESVLASLGLHVEPGPHLSGLLVYGVEPGSRAQAAGIAPQDALVSLDGIRVATPADVRPAPGSREAALGVRRPGSASETLRIVSLDGLPRVPPTDLFGSGLVIVAALAIVVLFAAPTPAAVALVLDRAASRVRARMWPDGLGARSPFGAGLSRAFRQIGRDLLHPLGVPALADAVAFALLAVVPLGQYVLPAQLDVGILFVAVAVALATAVLLSSQSLWLGLSGACHVVCQHIPAAAAVASVVLTSGSLRIQEIARTQGGWPWDWLAFRSPAALIACVLLLSSSRIDPSRASSVPGLAAFLYDAAAEPGASGGPWLSAAVRAHRIVFAGLAAVLFLGGWLLPGLQPAQQDARPALQCLGAALLLAKTAAILFASAAARWALPVATPAARTRATLVWLLPLSAAALGMTAAWSWWSPSGAVQLLVSASLVVVAGLALVAVVQRLHCGVLQGAEVRLTPLL